MAQPNELVCPYHMPAKPSIQSKETEMSLCSCQDQALLDQGDFDILLRRYQAELTIYARCVLSSEALAEEALSEMTRRVLQRLQNSPMTLNPGTRFGAYLQRVLERVVADIRAETRIRTETLSIEALTEQGQDIRDKDAELHWLNDEEELQQFGALLLSHAATDNLNESGTFPATSAKRAPSQIQLVPPFQVGHSHILRATACVIQPRRDCILLRYLWGLGRKEIASIVGLTDDQVRNHLNEGKRDLGALLSYLWWEEEGWSLAQIASELKWTTSKAEQFRHIGRALYARAQRRGR